MGRGHYLCRPLRRGLWRIFQIFLLQSWWYEHNPNKPQSHAASTDRAKELEPCKCAVSHRAQYSTVHTYSGLKYRYKPAVLQEAESSSRSEDYLPVRTIYILWCHSSGKKQLATFLGAEKQVNILLLYSVYRGNHELAGVIWINGMETN